MPKKKFYKVKINFDYIIQENTLYLEAKNKEEAIENAKEYLINPTGKEDITYYKYYSFDTQEMNENNIEGEEIAINTYLKTKEDI